MKANNFKYKTAYACMAAGLSLVAATVGCSDKPGPPPTITTETGTKAPAPVAKPGGPVNQNNPPAGQPNHMTPEMKAQMERYQSMGKK